MKGFSRVILEERIIRELLEDIPDDLIGKNTDMVDWFNVVSNKGFTF